MRKHVITAAILALPLACVAAPQETPLPAGLKGRLNLTIEVARGNSVERSMTMEINLISMQTAPAHLLIDPLDDDARRQNAHAAKAGTALADEMANRKPDPKLEADLDSCQQDAKGPRCVRAMRVLEEQAERMQAQSNDAEPAPEWTSQHRYQGWGSDFAKGCGTVLAQIHGGQAPQQMRLPIDDSPEARIFTCGTTMGVDRRARKATLSIKPGSVAFSGKSERKGTNFLDFADFVKGSGIEGKRMSGELVLSNISVAGDGASFEGSRTVKARSGFATTVRWKFVPRG